MELNVEMAKEEINAIGLMSGTSLDGLDVVHATFYKQNNSWTYRVNSAKTFIYNDLLREKLSRVTTLSGLELAFLHVELGVFFGNSVNHFLQKIELPTDFVASHGHTIFHQPHQSLTLQIASPAHIASATGLPVIADFRSGDVALGGNGAPLVPIGDHFLFAEYGCCVNLGGIANCSYIENNQRVAFDICPFNLVFNHFAAQLDLPYDDKGALTATGVVNAGLLAELDALAFYKQTGPKSLGVEWLNECVFPLLAKYKLSPANSMATFCAHCVNQFEAILKNKKQKVLLTGGGAYHSFFVEQLQKRLPELEIFIPDDTTIQFKEALIFAFLGVLRWRGENNCLASVTGAKRDSMSGAIYGP